jgi:hypothetical protein
VGKPAMNTAPTCFGASLAHRRCPFQRQIHACVTRGPLPGHGPFMRRST